MRIIMGLTAAASVLMAPLAIPLAAGAAPASGQFKVTNDTPHIVECVLLVNGKTRTYLKVHPGKAYFDTFLEGRTLQLVCMRARTGVYGPLKLGVDYRFVDAPGDHIDLTTE
jgi:hypothetical protein